MIGASLLACGAGLLACAARPAMAAPAADAAAPGARSGLDTQYFDDSVRPQDDIYRHVNGKWLESFQIPADRGLYDQFTLVEEAVQGQLRTLIEGLERSAYPADPDQRKIADLYATFMDPAALEPLGLAPLAQEFARIRALRSRADIPALIAHVNEIGVSAPYEPLVHQDEKDSTRYVVDLGQGGLGMPDRDYYLQSDERLRRMRASYLAHVRKMLTLAGDAGAGSEARAIVALETALARIQWTQVENRDPIKTYNRYAIAQLAVLAPGYGWDQYLRASGVQGRVDALFISQPSYITGFARLWQRTPLRVWKAYFRWHVLNAYARYLSKAFVDERFAFSGGVLQGAKSNQPRWRRGISLVDGCIGEGLGKLYVARYFPPAYKARMDELVGNLLAAYRADFEELDWLGPQTRQQALAKLALFNTKIGYPAKTRDYSALAIQRGDLVGDVERCNEFEWRRNLAKLGQPVDRSEWLDTAPTVNAYYSAELNEIVFPAGILQPPFFNAAADDAVNYGSIGTIIGHEISHGFDDQGSQYDGHGNLLDPPGWWTAEDLARFKSRTHRLVEQYSAFAPLPGFHVNGELTLGENIADNSGLAIAYKAWRISLHGQPAPVIDGLTSEQRFYMGHAQAWRSKARDAEIIRRIKIDPHAPDPARVTIVESNQDPFYAAFGVKPGDRMYLPPEQRVHLF
jgi:predicted metalloendopeptidase